MSLILLVKNSRCMQPNFSLHKKYNIAVPRYTSYPTVPHWPNTINLEAYKKTFSEKFARHNPKEGISLYLHLPFCEVLCTYCGCNKKITKKHSVENQYTLALWKEWEMYLNLMDSPPIIRELHLGGGTPTFFSPENLKEMLEGIFKDSKIHAEAEMSFEGHPNNTTREHLEVLYDLGFRRVSFGVQDNDPAVQKAINRIQPFENVVAVTQAAREIGYTSVNYDLVYGLPFQSVEGMEKTLKEIIEQRPDRIAFYAYAHIPWKSKAQRLYDKNDLPPAETRMQLYALGQKYFTTAGYVDIGMDHYALPEDELTRALEKGNLHRNFMGYTTANSKFLLGLGVSSISDVHEAYAQNEKILAAYYQKVNKGEFPLYRGYQLTEEDLVRKQYILDIACRRKTVIAPQHHSILSPEAKKYLDELESDGIAATKTNTVEVTPMGRQFLRLVCRAFDGHLQNETSAPTQERFSKAI